MAKIRILSWNVNGIRAALNKNFSESIKELNCDIICLQETKAHPSQLDHDLKDMGYEYEYWNSAQKKGYSGTAIFSKTKPINIKCDMGIEEHDQEGRIITAEYNNFYLVTVYTPNSQRGLARLEYRQKWDKDFLNFVKNLERTKPVIFCGDLNVAHKEIDLANPQTNKTTKSNPGNAGFTDEERKDFDNILNAGFIDSFRELYPNKIQYTWWSYMFSARQKNIGWRIDYFCLSNVIKKNIIDAKIHDKILGSDHCPIELEIDM